jgi:hypothetical protein
MPALYTDSEKSVIKTHRELKTFFKKPNKEGAAHLSVIYPLVLLMKKVIPNILSSIHPYDFP